MTTTAPPDSPLTGQVRALMSEAAAAYAGTPQGRRLDAALTRMDEPLRVALAGRLKAGKSTLLNALVGERLAATDAAECTRVVTWYVDGPASRAWAHPHHGGPRQLRLTRDDGQSVVDLGEFSPDDLDHLSIETPSSRLRRMTLIDTPGIGSLSSEISARTTAFMTRSGGGENGTGDEVVGPGGEPGADAVLYLMRHLHASDVGFLDAFHDGQRVGSTPVTAIGILSRADEIGSGRTDALDVAGRVARDYRKDARVRALVATVIPVAGLLAEAGVSLTERDYATLRTLAGDPPSMFLSADRFLDEHARTDVPAAARADLVRRTGLFGVRLAVELIRLGVATDAGQLALQLRRRSGIDQLREVLLTQFAQRRDLLKAQHAVRTLEVVLETRPGPDEPRLRRRLEALLAGAHDFAELRLLNDLRTGVVVIAGESVRTEAETLLGGAGTDVRARLGLDPGTDAAEVRAALVAALQRWQRRAVSPIADTGTRRTAEVVRRSIEGLLSQ